MTNAATLAEIDPWAGLQQALEHWTCAQHPPGQITHPDQLDAAASASFSAASPGTVASALAAAGQWDFDRPVDIDASDWSFRTSFAAPERPCYLCCDGLATRADVWLNGQRVLAADNMFRAYRADISSLLRAENDLVLLFRSLKEDLKQRRPRPRWKTNLVNHQQLRWHRTSLLGRIPGWSPCAPVVGPWRGVRVDASPVQFDAVQWRATLEGDAGVVNFHARLATTEDLLAAKLRVGEVEQTLAVQTDAEGLFITGTLRIDRPALWWPHTHGEPALYDCALTIETAAGEYEALRHRLGFRDFAVDQHQKFSVRVNGSPVFCRGACWTVSDLLSPSASPETLERDLRLARDAGVNLLRVGGTMTYESNAFYRLCDELGILVWQDFMFANMDYPVDDPSFQANIAAEATEQLDRLAGHPCLAIYCGNSEIEQQAAMLGMPREIWSNRWFAVELPALCRRRHPEAVYIPATPTGGAMPFHTRTGVTHYYGVGAYLRSPDELRKADVKFTSECLAFANVPEPAACFEIAAGGLPVMHHPRWKARVPRDTGAGWDFEDVRDHYLGQLYGVDPVRLRSFDLPRYLQLSRTASGEMMAQAFAEWRSSHSRNSGALVWFYKDLWPAAGWGVVDSRGRPKAAYYYLKRAWHSRQLVLTDEGLDGLDLHLINETATAVAGSVEVALLREPNVVVARRETPIRVEPRSTQLMRADEILGAFHDVTYAYRFGPPHHDVVIATWRDAESQVLGEAFHFVQRKANVIAPQAAIDVRAEPAAGGDYLVTVSADRFLHGVSLSAEGYLPEDNYFHLPPQRTRQIRLRPCAEPPRVFHAELEALNLATPIAVSLRTKTE